MNHKEFVASIDRDIKYEDDQAFCNELKYLIGEYKWCRNTEDTSLPTIVSAYLKERGDHLFRRMQRITKERTEIKR